MLSMDKSVSIFENKLIPDERRIFIAKVGDWTEKLYNSILIRDTTRPVWIAGPFHSPYNCSEWYDRQILVASGIGITPALSAIQAHQGTCRVNVIWAIRDPFLLEFILEYMLRECFDQSWILIYYTGKRKLCQRLHDDLPDNIKIINERPKLHIVIPNIIYSIEYGIDLPLSHIATRKDAMMEMIFDWMEELEANNSSDDVKMTQLTYRASSHGFQLSPFLISNDYNYENYVSSTDQYQSILKLKNNRDVLLSENTKETIEYNSSLGSERDLSLSTYMKRMKTSMRKLKDGTQPFRPTLEYNPSLGSKRDLSVLTYMRRMKTTMRNLTDDTQPFRPWDESSDQIREMVKKLCKKTVISTWSLLYCGSSLAIENALEDISAEYKLSLKKESLAW